MKKLLLSLFALMAIGVNAWAEGISIPAVEVRQGGTGEIQFYLTVTGSTNYNGYAFNVTLPAGITSDIVVYEGVIDYEEDGKTPIYGDVEGPTASLGTAVAGFAFGRNFVSKEEPQEISFAVYDGTGESRIRVTDGQAYILKLTIKADASLPVGEVLTGSLSNIHLSTSASQDVAIDDLTFEIKVVENVLILDESSTELPEIAENQNVLVKRTVTANEWGTICLPFGMTASQVKEVFGEGTEIAYFMDYTINDGNPASTSASSNATNISINFESDSYIEANMPCLIKPANSLTEFTLLGIDVDPDGGDNLYEYKQGRKTCGIFYGTMKAGETIPKDGLFLSGGKFWYSTGSTVIKGFRGYFVLNDVLADVASSGVKMQVNVDGLPTRVNDLQFVNSDGAAYTIDGKKINNTDRLPKGVYIIDGKKVAIK